MHSLNMRAGVNPPGEEILRQPAKPGQTKLAGIWKKRAVSAQRLKGIARGLAPVSCTGLPDLNNRYHSSILFFIQVFTHENLWLMSRWLEMA